MFKVQKRELKNGMICVQVLKDIDTVHKTIELATPWREI